MAQEELQRLRPDRCLEAVLAVLIDGIHILFFAQKLLRLQIGQPRVRYNTIFKIENALDILERHVEHHADPRRKNFQKPHMRNRSRKLDMPHALAAHLGMGHLDAALLANDPLVLHALVLAAKALVVLDRSENFGAEQPLGLGLERAVVDGLRFLDLAARPRANLFGRRKGDPNRIKGLRRRGLARVVKPRQVVSARRRRVFREKRVHSAECS